MKKQESIAKTLRTIRKMCADKQVRDPELLAALTNEAYRQLQRRLARDRAPGPGAAKAGAR